VPEPTGELVRILREIAEQIEVGCDYRKSVPVLDINGTRPSGCKGLWVIGGSDVLIEDVEFSGAHLRPTPLWILRIMSAALILNVGVLIGLTILAVLGVMPWSLLGTIFKASVVPTTLIGVLCSVGFTMYETLQYKAQYETARARFFGPCRSCSSCSDMASS